MTDAVRSRIEKDIADHKILLYMKGTPEMPRCGFSMQTSQVLKSLGVEFKAINVLEDPEIWDGIREYSDWPTIPQVYVDGTFVGGCDIVTEMHRNGELAPLVQKAVGA